MVSLCDVQLQGSSCMLHSARAACDHDYDHDALQHPDTLSVGHTICRLHSKCLQAIDASECRSLHHSHCTILLVPSMLLQSNLTTLSCATAVQRMSLAADVAARSCRKATHYQTMCTRSWSAGSMPPPTYTAPRLTCFCWSISSLAVFKGPPQPMSKPVRPWRSILWSRMQCSDPTEPSAIACMMVPPQG